TTRTTASGKANETQGRSFPDLRRSSHASIGSDLKKEAIRWLPESKHQQYKTSDRSLRCHRSSCGVLRTEIECPQIILFNALLRLNLRDSTRHGNRRASGWRAEGPRGDPGPAAKVVAYSGRADNQPARTRRRS